MLGRLCLPGVVAKKPLQWQSSALASDEPSRSLARLSRTFPAPLWLLLARLL